jgi:hypothetical protein
MSRGSSGDPEQPGRRGASRVIVFYAIAAAAAAVLPWVPALVPTQDGPQHLRLNEILLELRADPGSPLGAVFADGFGSGLRTASLFTWLCIALQDVATVDTCLRLYLSACIAGTAAVGWAWVRRLFPEQPARALVLLPFLVPWHVTMGFLPFIGSVPLAALAVLLLHGPAKRPRARAVAAVLVFGVLFVAHVSSLSIAIALAALDALLDRERRARRMALLVGTALPALVLALVSSTGGAWDNSGNEAVAANQPPLIQTTLWWSLPVALCKAIGGFFARAGMLSELAQGAALLVALALVAANVRRLARRRGSVLEISLTAQAVPVLVFFGLLLGVAILPWVFLSWAYMSMRLVPYAILCLPLAVWWPAAGGAAERRLAILIGALAVAATLAVGAGWRVIGENLARVERAASVLEPGTRVLPIMFLPPDDGHASLFMRTASRYRIGLDAWPELHGWAYAARRARAMVPFGLEHARQMAVYARVDANPPLPPGPDEFIGNNIWGEPEPVSTPRIYAEIPGDLQLEEVSEAARFLLPAIDEPKFWDHLRAAVLDQAAKNYHYLLAVHAPPSVRAELAARGWPVLYAEGDVFVYRLGLPLDQLVVPRSASSQAR